MTTTRQQCDHLSHNDAPWGACPDCATVGTYPYTNIGRGHWFYCADHKTVWFVGSNLFSSWKFETEAEQQAEYDRIGMSTFRHVEPVYGIVMEERCAACDRRSFEAIWQCLQDAMNAQPELASNKSIENASMIAYAALEERGGCAHDGADMDGQYDAGLPF
jgi:hypothetical protein